MPRVPIRGSSALKALYRFSNVKHMSKLYYTPTSCGAASFTAAFTANVKLDCEQVALNTHKTASGADYYKINPKGNVPCLVLDDGTVLNENAAVLQYIADQSPGSIAPANGTQARAVLQNALSYISSEVHPSIGGLYNPKLGEETRNFIRGNASRKLEYLEKELIGDRKFLVGDGFTIADSYLYVVLTWTQYLKIDLTPYPRVQAYLKRISELDNVRGAQARMTSNPSTTV